VARRYDCAVTGDTEDRREKRVPPPSDVPADWYPDPDEPATRRYWDGEEWTEWTEQAYERDFGGEQGSKNDTLVVIGWITAVLIPIVGLILGIVAASRGDKRGTYVIICSIVFFLLGFIYLSAKG
jgi:hypothetical protein